MDLVELRAGTAEHGRLVAFTVADDLGGDPAEVVARVVQDWAAELTALPGPSGVATWAPGTPMAQSFTVTF